MLSLEYLRQIHRQTPRKQLDMAARLGYRFSKNCESPASRGLTWQVQTERAKATRNTLTKAQLPTPWPLEFTGLSSKPPSPTVDRGKTPSPLRSRCSRHKMGVGGGGFIYTFQVLTPPQAGPEAMLTNSTQKSHWSYDLGGFAARRPPPSTLRRTAWAGTEGASLGGARGPQGAACCRDAAQVAETRASLSRFLRPAPRGGFAATSHSGSPGQTLRPPHCTATTAAVPSRARRGAYCGCAGQEGGSQRTPSACTLCWRLTVSAARLRTSPKLRLRAAGAQNCWQSSPPPLPPRGGVAPEFVEEGGDVECHAPALVPRLKPLGSSSLANRKPPSPDR
ncbi:hypothetical protein MC885_007626 [Smutsia gigantea]|nr:hypothetical protein MC885_007626 [Smutsia gigantea]